MNALYDYSLNSLNIKCTFSSENFFYASEMFRQYAINTINAAQQSLKDKIHAYTW